MFSLSDLSNRKLYLAKIMQLENQIINCIVMKCLHMYFILLQICWSVKSQKGFGCRSNLGVLSKGRVLEGGQQQLMERNMCPSDWHYILHIQGEQSSFCSHLNKWCRSCLICQWLLWVLCGSQPYLTLIINTAVKIHTKPLTISPLKIVELFLLTSF